MTIDTRHMKETITYWERTGDDVFGKPTFDTPITIKGRWEDRIDLFVTNAGEEEASNAVVYVSQDVSLEGYLAKGDLTGDSDPLDNSGAYRIRRFTRQTDLRNINVTRQAIL